MNSQKKLKKGFSLVELMIVVAVMAILATVGFFAYNNFQKTAKDSKRKSDLKAVATALQAYYSENGKYPVPNTVATPPVEQADGGILDVDLASYGGKVPSAPATTALTGNNVEYMYAYTATGSSYALCAQLEGTTGAWVVSSVDVSGTLDASNGECTAP